MLAVALTSALAFTLGTSTASAHAVVKPGEAGVAEFQSFTLGVPSEKAQETVGVRLVMPEGLSHVTPVVKPGWEISVQKDDSGEVTELAWTGGSIPAGFRDDFSFSAKVPSEPTALVWKVYQTYADGSTVSWNQDPAADSDNESEDTGPYSVTHVINDLADTPERKDSIPRVISVVALAVALLGFSRTVRPGR